MNLKWSASEILEYYFESRNRENAAFNEAGGNYRKSSFFSSRRECAIRRAARIAAGRVMLTNFLLRHAQASGASDEQIKEIESDAEAFYNCLTAFAGSTIKKQTMKIKDARVFYFQNRDLRILRLEHHMEEVYSLSWWKLSHAESALRYIPDLLKLCAFLLQYAERAMLSDEQRAMLLRDEEMYYAYLVRLLREV